MPERIRLRRDTSQAWLQTNPVLGLAEFGWESDTGHFRVGNGSSRFNDLPTYSTLDFIEAFLDQELRRTIIFETRDPGPTDDRDVGYTMPCIWYNRTTKAIFFQESDASNAAVWRNPVISGNASKAIVTRTDTATSIAVAGVVTINLLTDPLQAKIVELDADVILEEALAELAANRHYEMLLSLPNKGSVSRNIVLGTSLQLPKELTSAALAVAPGEVAQFALFRQAGQAKAGVTYLGTYALSSPPPTPTTEITEFRAGATNQAAFQIGAGAVLTTSGAGSLWADTNIGLIANYVRLTKFSGLDIPDDATILACELILQTKWRGHNVNRAFDFHLFKGGVPPLANAVASIPGLTATTEKQRYSFAAGQWPDNDLVTLQIPKIILEEQIANGSYDPANPLAYITKNAIGNGDLEYRHPNNGGLIRFRVTWQPAP